MPAEAPPRPRAAAVAGATTDPVRHGPRASAPPGPPSVAGPADAPGSARPWAPPGLSPRPANSPSVTMTLRFVRCVCHRLRAHEASSRSGTGCPRSTQRHTTAKAAPNKLRPCSVHPSVSRLALLDPSLGSHTCHGTVRFRRRPVWASQGELGHSVTVTSCAFAGPDRRLCPILCAMLKVETGAEIPRRSGHPRRT